MFKFTLPSFLVFVLQLNVCLQNASRFRLFCNQYFLHANCSKILEIENAILSAICPAMMLNKFFIKYLKILSCIELNSNLSAACFLPSQIGKRYFCAITKGKAELLQVKPRKMGKRQPGNYLND